MEIFKFKGTAQSKIEACTYVIFTGIYKDDAEPMVRAIFSTEIEEAMFIADLGSGSFCKFNGYVSQVSGSVKSGHTIGIRVTKVLSVI